MRRTSFRSMELLLVRAREWGSSAHLPRSPNVRESGRCQPSWQVGMKNAPRLCARRLAIAGLIGGTIRVGSPLRLRRRALPPTAPWQTPPSPRAAEGGGRIVDLDTCYAATIPDSTSAVRRRGQAGIRRICRST